MVSCSTGSPFFSRRFLRFVKMCKEEQNEEQSYPNRDGCIRDIKNVELKTQLGKTKENEIDHRAAIMDSVNQVSCCPSQNQSKGELVGKRH